MSAASRFFSSHSTRRFLKARVQTELSSSSAQHHRERKEYVVQITRKGFSTSALVVNEGETVTWKWASYEGTTGHNVVQVSLSGNNLHVVKGGLSSGKVVGAGEYSYTFRCQGTYHFISQGLSKRRSVLTITVQKRPSQIVRVADDGFHPRTLRIDSGTMVMFVWEACTLPRAVRPLRNGDCPGDCAEGNPLMMRDTSGSFQETFTEPGEYCFTSEASLDGLSRHLCIIAVQRAVKEWLVNVSDHGFAPALLEVLSEDRVWFSWEKKQCKKAQYIVRVASTSPDESQAVARIAASRAKQQATREGRHSQVFSSAGVYHYGSCGLPPHIVCTVMVRTSTVQESVMFTEGGFSPQIVSLNQSLQLGWSWDVTRLNFNFTINQPLSCTTEVGPVPTSESADEACVPQRQTQSSVGLLTNVEGDEAQVDMWREIYGELGSSSVTMNDVGVFFFRTTGRGADPWMVCVVDPFPRDHTVHITPNGFEPPELRIRPGDTVWWQWNGSKQNVLQVDKTGQHQPSFFTSGQESSYGAFAVTLGAVGDVNIMSEGHMGASAASTIHVEPVKRVRCILVDERVVQPNLIVASVGDIACLIWQYARPFFVYPVSDVLAPKVTVLSEPVELVGQDSSICGVLNLDKPGTFHYIFRAKAEKKTAMPQLSTADSLDVEPQRLGRSREQSFSSIACLLLTIIVEEQAPDSKHLLSVNDRSHSSRSVVGKVAGLDSVVRQRTYSSASTTRGMNRLSHKVPSVQSMNRGFQESILTWMPADRDAVQPLDKPVMQTKLNSLLVATTNNIFLNPPGSDPDATVLYTTDFSAPRPGGKTTMVLEPNEAVKIPRQGLFCVRAVAEVGGRVSEVMTTSLLATNAAASQLRHWHSGARRGIAPITSILKKEPLVGPDISSDVLAGGCVIVHWPCVMWPDSDHQVTGYAVALNNTVCCQVEQPDVTETEDGKPVLCQVEIKDLCSGSYILVVSAEHALVNPPVQSGPLSQDITINIDDASPALFRLGSISAMTKEGVLDTSFYKNPSEGSLSSMLLALRTLSEAKGKRQQRNMRKKAERSVAGFYQVSLGGAATPTEAPSKHNIYADGGVALKLAAIADENITFRVAESAVSHKKLLIVGQDFTAKNNAASRITNALLKQHDPSLFPSDSSMECLVWPIEKTGISVVVQGCRPGTPYMAIAVIGQDMLSEVLFFSLPTGNLLFWIESVTGNKTVLQWNITDTTVRAKEYTLAVDGRIVKSCALNGSGGAMAASDVQGIELTDIAPGTRRTLQLFCNVPGKLVAYSNLVTVHATVPCLPLEAPRRSTCRNTQTVKLRWPRVKVDQAAANTSRVFAKVDEYRVFVNGEHHTSVLHSNATSTQAQSVNDDETSSRHHVAYFNKDGVGSIEAVVTEIDDDQPCSVTVQAIMHARLHPDTGQAVECWHGQKLAMPPPLTVSGVNGTSGHLCPELQLVKVGNNCIHISWAKSPEAYKFEGYRLFVNGAASAFLPCSATSFMVPATGGDEVYSLSLAAIQDQTAPPDQSSAGPPLVVQYRSQASNLPDRLWATSVGCTALVLCWEMSQLEQKGILDGRPASERTGPPLLRIQGVDESVPEGWKLMWWQSDVGLEEKAMRKLSDCEARSGTHVITGLSPDTEYTAVLYCGLEESFQATLLNYMQHHRVSAVSVSNNCVGCGKTRSSTLLYSPGEEAAAGCQSTDEVVVLEVTTAESPRPVSRLRVAGADVDALTLDWDVPSSFGESELVRVEAHPYVSSADVLPVLPGPQQGNFFCEPHGVTRLDCIYRREVPAKTRRLTITPLSPCLGYQIRVVSLPRLEPSRSGADTPVQSSSSPVHTAAVEITGRPLIGFPAVVEVSCGVESPTLDVTWSLGKMHAQSVVKHFIVHWCADEDGQKDAGDDDFTIASNTATLSRNWQTTTHPASATSCQIDGLTASQRYVVAVVTVVSNGSGADFIDSVTPLPGSSQRSSLPSASNVGALCSAACNFHVWSEQHRVTAPTVLPPPPSAEPSAPVDEATAATATQPEQESLNGSVNGSVHEAPASLPSDVFSSITTVSGDGPLVVQPPSPTNETLMDAASSVYSLAASSAHSLAASEDPRAAGANAFTLLGYDQGSVTLEWSRAEAATNMAGKDLVVEKDGMPVQVIKSSQSLSNCSIDVDWLKGARLTLRSQDGDSDEIAPSISLPSHPQDGLYFTQLSAKYLENDSELESVMKVSWTLSSPDDDSLERVDVVWREGKGSQAPNRISVAKSATEYAIQNCEARTTYQIFLEAVLDDDVETTIPSSVITCRVPGPPDAPQLRFDSSSGDVAVLSWNMPVTYGDVLVNGYRLCINGEESKDTFSDTTTSTTIPLEIEKCYIVSLAAVTNHARWPKSPESSAVCVNPPMAVPMPSRRGSSSTAPGTMTLQVINALRNGVALYWTDLRSTYADELSHYILRWNTSRDPKIHTVRVSGACNCHNLLGLEAATTFSLRVLAQNSKGHVLFRSKQKLIETPAAMMSPPPMASSPYNRRVSLEPTPTVRNSTNSPPTAMSCDIDLELLPEDSNVSFDFKPRHFSLTDLPLASVKRLQTYASPGRRGGGSIEDALLPQLSLEISSSSGVGSIQTLVSIIAQCCDSLLARQVAVDRIIATKPSEIRKKQSEALYIKSALHCLSVEMKNRMAYINNPQNVEEIGLKFLLSWEIPAGGALAEATAYQVLINGQKWGSALPVSATDIAVQLSDPSQTYELCLAMIDESGSILRSSEVWHLTAMDYVPVRYFCMTHSHAKGAKYPDHGSCSYLETFREEMKIMNVTNSIHRGLIVDIEKMREDDFRPASSSTALSNVLVLDIQADGRVPLIDASAKTECLQIILFWTDWCTTAQQTLSLFQGFAKEHASELLTFQHCCVECTHYSVDDIRTMHRAGGWLSSKPGSKAVCGCHVLRAGRLLPSQVFRVAGVPTICIVYKETIVWQGRNCCNEPDEFAASMQHAISGVRGAPCPVAACILCAPCEEMLPKMLQAELTSLRGISQRSVARPTIRRSQRDDPQSKESALGTSTDSQSPCGSPGSGGFSAKRLQAFR